MRRRHWLIFVAACLFVSPIGFTLGRWSGAAPRHWEGSEQYPVAKAGAENKSNASTATTDYSSVLIENLGQVGFDQALGLLRSAPKEALVAWTKRLEGLPVGPRRTAGITAFFKTLAQINPSTAVDLALSMSLQEPRWNAIGAISSAIPAVNLSEVARMYTALNEKKLGLSDLVLNWSRSDPVATARFLSSYAGEVENSDVRYLMMNWAALDPAAAGDWLAKHPDRREPTVYTGLYSGWLENDRAAALNDLRTHLGDQAFDKALEAVSKDLFKESRDEARAFLLTLPPAAQEKSVWAIVGDVTAVYLGGGPELQADEVAKWLITLPEKLWREQIGQVINRWPEKELAARDRWIDQLPLDTRDAVLADFCQAFGPYPQPDNIRAGLKIRDPSLRVEAFRHLLEREPEARQELLTNSDLSPAETEVLAKILKSL